MINQNLGAFDIAVLERFLRSDHAPEDCATIPEMDGVLTAVTIGPDIILTGECLAALWGEESPIFGSNEEAGAVIGALNLSKQRRSRSSRFFQSTHYSHYR